MRSAMEESEIPSARSRVEPTKHYFHFVLGGFSVRNEPNRNK